MCAGDNRVMASHGEVRSRGQTESWRVVAKVYAQGALYEAGGVNHEIHRELVVDSSSRVVASCGDAKIIAADSTLRLLDRSSRPPLGVLFRHLMSRQQAVTYSSCTYTAARAACAEPCANRGRFRANPRSSAAFSNLTSLVPNLVAGLVASCWARRRT